MNWFDRWITFGNGVVLIILAAAALALQCAGCAPQARSAGRYDMDCESVHGFTRYRCQNLEAVCYSDSNGISCWRR